MNVSASNSIHPQIQGRTDLPAAVGPTSETDSDGGDPVASAQGHPQDFGTILSDVGKGRGPVLAGASLDTRSLDDAADPGIGTGRRVDMATKQAADSTAATDPRAVLLDARSDPSTRSASDPSRTTKSGRGTDEPTGDPTTDAGADLSAQLALASQWTAATPAAFPVGSDSTADAGKSTKAKSDARTVAADAVANPKRAPAIPSVDIAPVQGAAIPIPVAVTAAVTAADGVKALDVDRNRRSTGAQAATAKSEDLEPEATSQIPIPESTATPIDKLFDLVAGRPSTASPDPTSIGKGTVRPVATDSTTASIDKLFNLVSGNASTASVDPTSITSQFVTQISAQVSNAQNSLTAATTSAPAALSETVGTPAWSHEVGQAALRMATNDIQNASLRLNPEHLGPLDVQMRIDNGVAHMQFAAAHADTRHAIESSRGTLDQMLGDQGMKLGDWSVGNSSANGSFARGFGTASSQGDGSRPSTNETGESGDTVSATVTTRATRPLGLVDTFA